MNFWYGLLAFVVIFIGYAYFNFRRMKRFSQVPDSKEIRHLNEKDFKQVTAKGLVLVDFWAGWCMPCKMMTPVLNDLSEALKSQALVTKVDVEKQQALATKFGIRSIPTLILFKNGKEVNRFQGVKTKNFLLKKIKEA